MKVITCKQACSLLKVGVSKLNQLVNNGEIRVTKFGHTNIYNGDDIDKFVKQHSNGRMGYADKMLSTKEACKYLDCTMDRFRRLCNKYNFACYSTDKYKSAKTFYKFEDLEEFKTEYERVKRIKGSM